MPQIPGGPEYEPLQGGPLEFEMPKKLSMNFIKSLNEEHTEKLVLELISQIKGL